MEYTVNDIIHRVLQEIPGAPFEHTVDTLKSGNGDMPVTGIVTTFIATMNVLRSTVEIGANMIITHEPTYFNHVDAVEWLADDSVYQVKHAFIESHHLAIWRFHDYWHAYKPDGIYTGLTKLLGWEAFWDPNEPSLYHLPGQRLCDLADFFKTQLGIPHIRVVGPLEMPCRKATLWVGSYPGNAMINAMETLGADVLICGEASEWQIYEYIRDANSAGIPKGLIILGHERSEEPGMGYLAEWLKERFPGIPITHIPAGDPLVIR